MKDIIIVGGGPIGLFLAGSLANSGVDVLVIEKKRKIGEGVICTGIIGREAFDKFQLPKNSIDHDLQKVELVSPSGEKIDYHHPFPFAYVVDRYVFDQSLAERAQDLGARILTGLEVTKVSSTSRRVDVVAKGRDDQFHLFQAQICVLATGNSFKLHHQLGLGKPSQFIFGGQANIVLKGIHSARLWFGKTHSPDGFAWQIPFKERILKIGLLSSSNPRPFLSEILKNYFSLPPENNNFLEISSKAIAQGIVSPSFGKRIIAVGEAAGQVKTTTGGGIFYGLIGAQIAEEIIKKALQQGVYDESFLSQYEELWREKLEKEIRLGLIMRKMYSFLDDKDINLLFRIARDDGVFPLIKHQGNFDWHSNLILSLIRHLYHYHHRLPSFINLSWEVWKRAKSFKIGSDLTNRGKKRYNQNKFKSEKEVEEI